jgi:hypothetical protein
MTAVATWGNVLCTNYQQSGNALVPNQSYSSTPLEAVPAVFVNATHRFFGIQVQAKQVRSQQPRSLPPICLTTPYQRRTHRLRAWPSSQHSICISGSRSSSGGREEKEHHVRPRRPIAPPLVPWQRPCTAAHRRSAALRWPCSDRSSADSWAVGACSTQRAANAAFHRSLCSCFFQSRVCLRVRSGQEKLLSIFPKAKKNRHWVCVQGWWSPSLGLFLFERSLVARDRPTGLRGGESKLCFDIWRREGVAFRPIEIDDAQRRIENPTSFERRGVIMR